MQDIFILSAVRTPIGKFGGAFADITAPELGAFAARAAIERAKIEAAQLNEVIMGNARPAGVGPNPARQIAKHAGVPFEVPAFTVNKACGSSLRAIISAVQAMKSGDAEVILAGGSESMSRVPYLLTKARWGYRLGHEKLVDGMYQDGFLCPLCGQVMGETAETLATQCKISREEQDRYAMETQHRCERARKENRFADEIVPVEVQVGKGEKKIIAADEHPRDGVTMESLAKLPPVFKKDGTVHAGNSSGIVDGAAAVVLATESFVKKYNTPVMARIAGYTIAGVDPAIMGIGPVPAVRTLLQKHNLKLEDIDLIELNEAFAAQVIACDRELHFDMSKLNVNGGAIALGHPIGATGARITVTLVHEMLKRKSKLGLATLCVSGGLGIALLVERV
ncbi:MAG: acetyl-CoA C-acetyltransferase [candidate division KSB1 bacterium]|nr:acetyl-CoA C-acetyltransferase [candidate division KSB1 bacterium]MDZ7366451.1 acetyl-CoA C-acetyltransferase [candidate division KSB1 bacterium]MDZ7404587.1 acetyl-CoA C-acetyltransferase [candidate division KSB1 bacterium]